MRLLFLADLIPLLISFKFKIAYSLHCLLLKIRLVIIYYYWKHPRLHSEKSHLTPFHIYMGNTLFVFQSMNPFISLTFGLFGLLLPYMTVSSSYNSELLLAPRIIDNSSNSSSTNLSIPPFLHPRRVRTLDFCLCGFISP